jgi:metallo-beta-lactamase family protein
VTTSIGFYGASGTVTGSRFLVEMPAGRVLVDCGLFQGPKYLREMNWNPLPFDPRGLDAVLLTHAHIDHSGYLPRLVKAGFRGPIYCTLPTKELARILLLDAANLQEEDAEYANRKGFSRHHPALPLFTGRDALDAVGQMEPVNFGETFHVASAEAHLYPAGHILGSAFVQLIVKEPDGSKHNLVFSGDLGRFDGPMHSDPRRLPDCDTLVMEATYGDRIHPKQSLADQIRGPIEETIRKGGTVLIPAFAVARTQLLTMLLRQHMADGELPTLPIHVDSPMAGAVTDVYHRRSGWPDVKADPRDLFPRGVHFHRTPAESKQLNESHGPSIIISSSGMLTGGRVLHHLKRLLPDKRNLVVLAGFQAEGTRGRALLEGAPWVRIHGQDIHIKARLATVDGMSAHADANELETWFRAGKKLPNTVFLVHGEDVQLKAMAKRVEAAGIEAVIPVLGERFELTLGTPLVAPAG